MRDRVGKNQLNLGRAAALESKEALRAGTRPVDTASTPAEPPLAGTG